MVICIRFIVSSFSIIKLKISRFNKKDKKIINFNAIKFIDRLIFTKLTLIVKLLKYFYITYRFLMHQVVILIYDRQVVNLKLYQYLIVKDHLLLIIQTILIYSFKINMQVNSLIFS